MINKNLQKLTGTPVCPGMPGKTLGSDTEAAKRPAVNSNIKGAKWLGGDTGGYGTAGVGGTTGYGGKRSQVDDGTH